MKKIKFLFFLTFLIGIGCLATGCIKPYDKPELITIEASQTAFLIPLIGDTTNQASFESEELLAEAKVATKEVQIPHRWVQTGRMSWSGQWRASAKLIVVERKPETREWTATKDSGSTSKNQAIYAESKESIGFSVGMNCSAQIDETEATKFLYRYNNKTLSDIMDTEIRAMVESEFVERCAKYNLNEILEKKDVIMGEVRKEVSNYFQERGIHITVLGMKEGLHYDDPSIQQAINDKFSSEQTIITQKNENKRILSEAKAKADADILKAKAQAQANKLLAASITQPLIDMKEAEARLKHGWVTIQGAASAIVNAQE